MSATKIFGLGFAILGALFGMIVLAFYISGEKSPVAFTVISAGSTLIGSLLMMMTTIQESARTQTR